MLAAVVALLTLNWVCAVARFQVNVLAWDQWDFLEPLFHGEGWWALFSRQHGPPRQGLGFVLTSWVMAGSLWDSRIESLWIVSLMAISAVLALRLKWRLTGTLHITDTWVPLLVLSLGQLETVISVPNASHSVFPLALLLAAANAWMIRCAALRYMLAGLSVFALLFTGFGIFGGLMLATLIATAAARTAIAREWRDFVWAFSGLILAISGLAAFAYGYEFQPASEGFRFPFEPWTDYVRFVILMLAHPSGLHGVSAAAYTVGTLVTVVTLGITIRLACQWVLTKGAHPTAEVYLLLLGAGALFAINASVGRVHLGPGSGMASRYITLLLPIPLAGGIWVSTLRDGWSRKLLLAGVWAIAVCPLIDVAGRPLQDWPGTIGLTNRARSDVEAYAEDKKAWVSAYLETGDWRKANALAGEVIHPSAVATRLEEKLAWLKTGNLSFFSPRGYSPWLTSTIEKAVWIQTYPAEGALRWMGRKAKLKVFSKRRGFVNIRVFGKSPALPAGAPLTFVHSGKIGTWEFSESSPALSLPIQPGETTVTIESAAGAIAPEITKGPVRDGDEPSFLLAPATLSEQPEGSEWAVDSTTDTWRLAHGWRAIAGLHGWENSGSFTWVSDLLVIEATATKPAFLNLHIARRFEALSPGRVGIDCEGRSMSLDPPSGKKGLGFSLQLAPRGQPYRIRIRDTGGARSPSELGLSGDQRLLSLKFDRITMDTQPAYPEVTLSP